VIDFATIAVRRLLLGKIDNWPYSPYWPYCLPLCGMMDLVGALAAKGISDNWPYSPYWPY